MALLTSVFEAIQQIVTDIWTPICPNNNAAIFLAVENGE